MNGYVFVLDSAVFVLVVVAVDTALLVAGIRFGRRLDWTLRYVRDRMKVFRGFLNRDLFLDFVFDLGWLLWAFAHPLSLNYKRGG